MSEKQNSFSIDFLDHVAIRVKDVNRSCEWYERVLGLKEYRIPEWDDYPVFMLSGRCGIAIFPANINDEKYPKDSKNIKIEHFAFNVSRENFEKAQEHYNTLGIEFTFQDHIHFHSIYTLDPDGHKVELTTLVSDPESFYGK